MRDDGAFRDVDSPDGCCDFPISRHPQTIPSTEAASLTHSPRSHHAGIARRFAHADKPKAEFNVVRSDAQSKRRVKKRGPSGGKTCRIRQAGGLSASAAASSTGAASSAAAAATELPSSATDSAAAQAASATSSVWTESAVASSSAAPESTAWTSTWVEYETEAASSAPAPAATSAVSSGGGSAGTGGWMNSGSKVGLCWPNGDWVSRERMGQVRLCGGDKEADWRCAVVRIGFAWCAGLRWQLYR